ncbi:glutamate carboxypeptidase [Prosthecobacter fusiformis]|uniref:Glutamate carboxypeptidase n=1 Tax=Prosthecobacter fusiformis TaxID=48464 RepID=A0A4R7S4M9_9BACT|nr:M20/M25/M40 family metallo-hydrolase [Prosthecobacter fusiformis]TDU72809.1 glutamate carboxypeptidase [Prosthecobacter fusiformis]
MIEELTARAQHHLPEALHWLRRMVEINSFTTNIAGIETVGRVTADCFASLGFTAEHVPATNLEHGPHLFLSRPGSDPLAQPIVLVTHLDTVFPPEEELQNNFTWQEEDSRIYGPGTVDNKGGTAMIWLILRTMQEVLPDLFEKTHWLIAANSAEEVIGSDFAQRTADRCPQGARCVLVFEGGPKDEAGYHIVTSRKGRLEYRITCNGRGAHAGSNHAVGINAVVELARVLPRIHALTDPARNLTINVASIHGGTVLNRVPHQAVTELEMRAFEPQVLEEAAQALAALAGRTEAGAEIIVECMGTTAAWPGGTTTDALFAAWEKAGAAMGLSVHPMARGGLSDANYLCTLAPTLDAMGPGGGNAHCSERSADGSKLPEFVDVDSFVPKVVMNVLALAELG